MVSLVTFDMAGTTVDDGGAASRALRAAVEETGASVAQEDLEVWSGVERTSAISALMALGGVHPARGAARAQFLRFSAILADSWRTDPPQEIAGATETFETLHEEGIRVALTTDLNEASVTPLMEELGWWPARRPLIDTVVTADDVASGCPAPYLIHRAMERTRVVDVRQVLAAGDTVVDLQAARNAGVAPVSVLTGAGDRQTLEAAGPDYLLGSIAELPAVISAAGSAMG